MTDGTALIDGGIARRDFVYNIETKPRFETSVNDGPEAQQFQQTFVTNLLCYYCTKYVS